MQYDKYLAYLESETWAKKRNEALMRDNFCCSICHNPNNLEVHHLRYPEILGEESLCCLMTLCKDCHAKLEAYKKGSWPVGKYRTWHDPRFPELVTYIDYGEEECNGKFGIVIIDGKNPVVLKFNNGTSELFKVSDQTLNELKDEAGASITTKFEVID